MKNKVWNEEGKYWVVVKDKKASHKHKLSFFCPHCTRITGTIDDKYLEEYGFCAECYVMHVEGRKNPTIDLKKYSPCL